MSLPVARTRAARPAASSRRHATPTADHGPATSVIDGMELLAWGERDVDLPAIPRVPGYEVLEVIGTGGMGVVLKARHLQLNRIVALKVLRPDSLADKGLRDRFQVEAEAVARLQHPNIIQVFDVGTFAAHPGNGRPNPYLSLEYVEGGSLFPLTLTPQTPRYSARMVEQLARAVHAAHQVGVIHRDLKPANVLLTLDGEPKVADFGLAKQLTPDRTVQGPGVTQHGEVMGTPEYLAPEQMDGMEPTAALDIYALGVILYELLTARVPFKGGTLVETMVLVKYEEPVSPRRLQPKLPRDLETICLKCLAKNPMARYATAEDLADDLARWAAGEPIRARPVGAGERLWRWARRNPSVAALSAGLLSVAVVGMIGVTWKWRDAERNAGAAAAAARDADDRLLAERWERYRANIAAGSAALQLNKLTSSRQALADAPEELRHWEWEYFRRRLDTSREAIPLTGSGLHRVQRVRDTSIVVTHHDDDNCVWDLDRRTVVARLSAPDLHPPRDLRPDRGLVALARPGRGVELRSLTDDLSVRAVLPLDRPIEVVRLAQLAPRVAAVDAASTVHVWDTESGRLCAAFPGHGGPCGGSFDFSADGRLVAQENPASATVFVWDAETGRKLFEFRRENKLFWVRFTPKGDRLLVAEAFPSNRVWLWDTRSGALVKELLGHQNVIFDPAFSPDGRLLATCSTDQTVRLWDLATGAAGPTLKGHSGAVKSVAFSPDSRQLVSASDDQSLRLWDVAGGRERAVVRGHTAEVEAVAFVDGGRTVASVSADSTIRYWDVAAAEADGVGRDHTGFVYDVCYRPDGRRAASAAWDGGVRIWDPATCRPVALLDHGPTHVFACAYHPNGRLLATLARDNKVRLWDVEENRVLHTWPAAGDHWLGGKLAFHPDGDLLACGCHDGSLHLFDVPARTEVACFRDHGDAVRTVAFSPDGRWMISAAVAAGGKGVVLRVWDVRRRVVVRTLSGHLEAVHALAFSRDGQVLASGSIDGRVRLWDTDMWACLGEMTFGKGVKVYALAFSFDGTRLACGCSDNSLRMCDVAARQEIVDLHGHADYVHAVAFSPDGRQLVSGSGDKTVRFWNTTGGTEPGRP